jgi:alkylhydroperoxidase/carboxymuconolactone decarboxylase family protein YurZ
MGKLPERYKRFMQTYPEIGKAYRELGDAVAEAGPLEPKVCALIKLGLSIGSKQEGAARSHVRKALEAGATADEIRHAVLQATTTVGFPAMMAGFSWAEDVLGSSSNE